MEGGGTESRGEDKEFSATVDPRLSIYRFHQRKAIVLCRKTTINTPRESIHNKYTSSCLRRRCRTKNRGREADMTDGQTRLSVQHAQQRVTFSFDHLHCSDEFPGLYQTSICKTFSVASPHVIMTICDLSQTLIHELSH